MKKILDLKNNKMFFRLVLVIILIISIFVFFIHRFNSYDKNIYSLPSNSILFGKDNEPILCEVNSNAYFTKFNEILGLNVASYIFKYIIDSLK